jgi:Domain of unknown function (DUF397)
MSQLHPVDLTAAVWRRSSLAQDDENHVEIAMLPDGHVAMRESAKGEAGDVLVFTPAEWDAFVLGAKDGEFDPPEESGAPAEPAPGD